MKRLSSSGTFENWSDGVLEHWSDEARVFLPLLQHSITPILRSVLSVSRLKLDDVMRRRLALAGGANTDIAGFGAQFRQRFCAQIAHPRLNAPDPLRQDAVRRAGNLF